MCVETKLQFKFGEDLANSFGLIEFLMFFKMAANGHIGFQNPNF